MMAKYSEKLAFQRQFFLYLRHGSDKFPLFEVMVRVGIQKRMTVKTRSERKQLINVLRDIERKSRRAASNSGSVDT